MTKSISYFFQNSIAYEQIKRCGAIVDQNVNRNYRLPIIRIIYD